MTIVFILKIMMIIAADAVAPCCHLGSILPACRPPTLPGTRLSKGIRPSERMMEDEIIKIMPGTRKVMMTIITNPIKTKDGDNG